MCRGTGKVSAWKVHSRKFATRFDFDEVTMRNAFGISVHPEHATLSVMWNQWMCHLEGMRIIIIIKKVEKKWNCVPPSGSSVKQKRKKKALATSKKVLEKTKKGKGLQ